MSVFAQIKELKTARKYNDAWQLGYSELQHDPNNKFLITSLYYVAYQAIKDIALIVEKRENNYLNDSEREAINYWLANLRDLNLVKSEVDIEFKFLLILFKTKIKQVTKELVEFILVSGSKLFNEEDLKPYPLDKGEVPSLVLWFAREVVKYASNYPKEVNGQKVYAFARYALSNAFDANSKGKFWLTYDLVSFFLAYSQFDRARECALQVLRNKKSEGWAWKTLGDTFLNEPSKAVKLYAKAILLAHDDTYKLSALKNLLSIKASDNDKTAARLLVNEIIRIYESNSWRLKEEILYFTRFAWFEREDDASLLMDKLKAWAVDAELLGVEKLTVAFGIVSDNHKSGKKVYVYLNKHTQLLVDKSLFFKGQLPKVGVCLELTGDFSNGKPFIIKANIVEHIEVEGCESYIGRLRLTGSADRRLGFVDDIFIPPHLLGNYSDGEQVSGITITAFDKKKNRYGKKAITINAA